MSRIGKLPVGVPSGVTVTIDGNKVTAKGQKGQLSVNVHPEISVSYEQNILSVQRPSDTKEHKALHGLSRALLNNMINGVTKGYEKKLEISGVGFKAESKNGRLVLYVGFSHQIVLIPPPGITVSVTNPTNLVVTGIDKEAVGQVAAKIRSLKKPEPYKGKGIRYAGEHILRKAGKKAGKGAKK
ncbi:50S ribosomal protein L6 [bacterium]|nr:50S ribosomal protein L6 [bacterium]